MNNYDDGVHWIYDLDIDQDESSCPMKCDEPNGFCIESQQCDEEWFDFQCLLGHAVAVIEVGI